jgi:hypothetical protein
MSTIARGACLSFVVIFENILGVCSDADANVFLVCLDDELCIAEMECGRRGSSPKGDSEVMGFQAKILKIHSELGL